MTIMHKRCIKYDHLRSFLFGVRNVIVNIKMLFLFLTFFMVCGYVRRSLNMAPGTLCLEASNNNIQNPLNLIIWTK